VTEALTTAAKSLEESMVPVLKSATADGKLTKEDQELVFNSAKELAAKIMGPDTQKLLNGVVDDTETYINAKLQEILNNMKASGNNITTKKVEVIEDKSEALNS
jgi:ribosomal protein L9